MPTHDNELPEGKTGRTFIHDDRDAKLVRVEPDHDEWHIWTEYQTGDGGLFYVSDHEDYTLDAEEFGPIEFEDGLRSCYLCGGAVPPKAGTNVCDQHH